MTSLYPVFHMDSYKLYFRVWFQEELHIIIKLLKDLSSLYLIIHLFIIFSELLLLGNSIRVLRKSETKNTSHNRSLTYHIAGIYQSCYFCLEFLQQSITVQHKPCNWISYSWLSSVVCSITLFCGRKTQAFRLM